MGYLFGYQNEKGTKLFNGMSTQFKPGLFKTFILNEWVYFTISLKGVKHPIYNMECAGECRVGYSVNHTREERVIIFAYGLKETNGKKQSGRTAGTGYFLAPSALRSWVEPQPTVPGRS